MQHPLDFSNSGLLSDNDSKIFFFIFKEIYMKAIAILATALFATSVYAQAPAKKEEPKKDAPKAEVKKDAKDAKKEPVKK